MEEQPADLRLCASCKQAKSRDLFSANQWKGKSGKEEQDKRRCVACIASETGVAAPNAAISEAAEKKKKAAKREAAERNKALELERDIVRKQHQQLAHLKEQKWLDGNGPQIKMHTFEVPGSGTLWDLDADTPGVTFNSLPTLASMVGSYDLIFLLLQRW